MTLQEALRPYHYDGTGMVSLYGDGPCDNLFLFTAESSALADRLGETQLAVDLARCGVVYAHLSEIEPGLFKRRPDDTGANSYDEYFGAAYCAWRMGDPYLADEILQYGDKHFYCYDVENPGKLSWRFFFARNITFIPFIKACAYQRVGVIGQMAWTIGALLSLIGPRESTSGKLLIDQQILPMWSTGVIAKIGVQLWLYGMKKLYPEGRTTPYTTYFGSHPLGSMQKEEWSLR